MGSILDLDHSTCADSLSTSNSTATQTKHETIPIPTLCPLHLLQYIALFLTCV